MTTAPGVIAHLLFAYVVLAEPLLGHRLYAAVRRSVKEDRRARARFYRWSIASEWLWVAVNALLLSGEALSLRELGLRLPGGESSPSTAGIVIGLVGGLVLLVVVTRVKARRSGQYGWLLPRSALEPFVELLPTTGRERRLFAALALTAGVGGDDRLGGDLRCGSLLSGVAWGVADVASRIRTRPPVPQHRHVASADPRPCTHRSAVPPALAVEARGLKAPRLGPKSRLGAQGSGVPRQR